jgi:predicted HicB family RNase H-like nuclease
MTNSKGDKAKPKTTKLEMSKELHTHLKITAVKKGETMNNLITKALEHYLYKEVQNG